LRSKRTPTLRLRLAWVLLIFFAALVPPHLALADSVELGGLQAPSPSLASLDGATYGPEGFTLAATAGPAPALAAGFSRFGTALAEPLALAAPTSRLKLTYSALTPPGTAALFDVRGSVDGRRWLPWVTDLRPGDVVAFSPPARHVQYRVTLLGGLVHSPSVRDVGFTATSQAPTATSAAPGPYAVAPTFRVRATRLGMVGGRTANGYVIPPRAHFVALPSRSVLSSRGGDEYKVRITYGGRSTVVPVYDVGPYSARDDYWDQQRDGYPQLERGWPQDHAAYYEGYNGGRADKGYVSYPTAMDVGDGVWLDDLGIVGDQAEVEVTYLWLGQDPAAGPPARDPDAPEQLVDELGGDFWHSTTLRASAVGCGYGRHAYWAQSTTDPAAGPVARWQPSLPVEAAYDVFVHIPACPAKRGPVTEARYVVQHRDGAVEVAVNQEAQTGWVHLGRFPFRAGADGFVQLGALAGDGGRAVWFDQARWVRVP
jgi:hypothetical protein